MKIEPQLFRRFRVLADVIDGIGDGANLLRVLVGNLDVEGLFESHHELDGVERIGAEVIHEGSARRNLALVHTQLLDNDLFHFFVNGCHVSPRSQIWGCASPVPDRRLTTTAPCL